MLGIDEINAEVRIFDSEEEILKCLIETNIRQRGVMPNPVKYGRCIAELEKLYGIRDGSAGKVGLESNNFTPNSDPKTEEEFAEVLGVTRQTLQNYKALADMIPEIQTLVETKIVTPTTARAIIKKLPEFQQKELAELYFYLCFWYNGSIERQVKETPKLYRIICRESQGWRLLFFVQFVCFFLLRRSGSWQA